MARAAETKADYIRTHALNDEYCRKLILDFLKEFGSATRADLDAFLLNKLGDVLSESQKLRKISNLLTNLRRSGQIVNRGSRKKSRWEIAE